MHSTIRRGSDWAALTKRVPVPWRKRRKILRKFQLPMMPRHPHRQMVSRALQRQGSDQSSVREMNSSIGSVLNCYFRATLQLHHVCMWLNNVEPCLNDGTSQSNLHSKIAQALHEPLFYSNPTLPAHYRCWRKQWQKQLPRKHEKPRKMQRLTVRILRNVDACDRQQPAVIVLK